MCWCDNIFSKLRYTWAVIKYRIMFNQYSRMFKLRLQVQLSILAIERRHRYGNFPAEKHLEIISRFWRMRHYNSQKITKIVCREMSQFIADYSIKTGIPQWNIRSILKKDFDIDV